MARKKSINEETLPLPWATLHILLSLTDGPKHGYAIMGRVEELSDGAVSMGPGTLYGSIKRMLADRLIEEVSGPADGDERRRYYQLTAPGEAACAAEVARLNRLLRHATVRRWASPAPRRA